jgi:hypothetical protein
VKNVTQPANRKSNFWSFENVQVKRRGLVDVTAYELDPPGRSQCLVDRIEIFLKTALKMFVRAGEMSSLNCRSFLVGKNIPSKQVFL